MIIPAQRTIFATVKKQRTHGDNKTKPHRKTVTKRIKSESTKISETTVGKIEKITNRFEVDLTPLYKAYKKKHSEIRSLKTLLRGDVHIIANPIIEFYYNGKSI